MAGRALKGGKVDEIGGGGLRVCWTEQVFDDDPLPRHGHSDVQGFGFEGQAEAQRFHAGLLAGPAGEKHPGLLPRWQLHEFCKFVCGQHAGGQCGVGQIGSDGFDVHPQRHAVAHGQQRFVQAVAQVEAQRRIAGMPGQRRLAVRAEGKLQVLRRTLQVAPENLPGPAMRGDETGLVYGKDEASCPLLFGGVEQIEGACRRVAQIEFPDVYVALLRSRQRRGRVVRAGGGAQAHGISHLL